MRRRDSLGQRGLTSSRRTRLPQPSPRSRPARPSGRRLLTLTTGLLVRLGCATSREYAAGAWSTSFYQPTQLQILAVGLVNEGSAYLATVSGIKALHEGHLTPVVEAVNEEVKAFHLCHHRNSIFYEALSRDGGALSIYEYSLVSREKVQVAEFQDAPPATSLACADNWLLRASPSDLGAVHVSDGAVSVLRHFDAGEGEEAISSLTVGYAADVIDRAQVLAVSPGNRTILRLRFQVEEDVHSPHPSVQLREAEGSGEVLLHAGDGADGPLADASAWSPRHVLWTQEKVLFIDGCSVRQVTGSGSRAHVTTLAGAPAECAEAPRNETLEPVPWASRLSRPLGLAGTAVGTREDTALMLTEAQVVHVVQRPNACAAHPDEGACAAGHGCGWAAGPGTAERQCLECNELEAWAKGLKPVQEACSLELAPRSGTRYALSGCGCVAPDPAPPSGDGDDRDGLQAFLSVVLVIAALVAGVFLYRRHRREAQLRELYGVDTAEFHTFTDSEYLH